MIPQKQETGARQKISRFSHLKSSQDLSTEQVILAASVLFATLYNNQFWAAALNGHNVMDVGTWMYAAALFVLLIAAHSFLLSFLVAGRFAKPVLTALFIASALAVYYMRRYTVFFDMSMLRNVLNTDVKEAKELLSWDMLLFVLLYGVLPSVLIWRVRIRRRSWRRAIVIRSVFTVGTLIVVAVLMAAVFQNFSALMRNQKEVRFLITPGNFIVGFVRVLAADTASVQKNRIPIGLDARLDDHAPKKNKPTLLVLVVGETARAANWGLNGYSRQTTPKLSALNVVNFPLMTSCGTNTEVSLPCMFSPFGRKNYNEKAIREHESLLHVLAKAGFHVSWRDNQSGCKGVCDGLELQRLDSSKNATLCDGERCIDEILLERLEEEVQHADGNAVIVLHQLGNHGPAYYRRYPAAFRLFTPTCDTNDLGKCTREQIVNSYDNALLYTDHFLSKTIERLKQQTSHDTAMIYVSDHGESLGEKGIYLHGLPYAIAPKEQTEIPMIMWMSEDFSSSYWLNKDCMRQEAQRSFNHDYLFHSVLGILGIKTKLYDPSYDITTSCRL